MFVQSLFWFAVGAVVGGGGIILTCPLCTLNVVIKNFCMVFIFCKHEMCQLNI